MNTIILAEATVNVSQQLEAAVPLLGKREPQVDTQRSGGQQNWKDKHSPKKAIAAAFEKQHTKNACSLHKQANKDRSEARGFPR